MSKFSAVIAPGSLQQAMQNIARHAPRASAPVNLYGQETVIFPAVPARAEPDRRAGELDLRCPGSLCALVPEGGCLRQEAEEVSAVEEVARRKHAKVEELQRRVGAVAASIPCIAEGLAASVSKKA